MAITSTCCRTRACLIATISKPEPRSIANESRIMAVAFSASPVAADGKIYLPSEDGDMFVVKAGPKFEVLVDQLHRRAADGDSGDFRRQDVRPFAAAPLCDRAIDSTVLGVVVCAASCNAERTIHEISDELTRNSYIRWLVSEIFVDRIFVWLTRQTSRSSPMMSPCRSGTLLSLAPGRRVFFAQSRRANAGVESW